MPSYQSIKVSLFVFILTTYACLCWSFTWSAPPNFRMVRVRGRYDAFPWSSSQRSPSRKPLQTLELFTTELFINEGEQLEFWVFLFASSHIGMSAIREKLIYSCGQFADAAKLIDRGIRLPSYWPGDDVGKDEIFPDKETAGRQIYRVGYTLVSFTTLGSALTTYLAINAQESSGVERMASLTSSEQIIYFSIASLSFSVAISSLFNASPLGLMPGFERSNDIETSNEGSRAQIAGLQRNDAIKFEPRGLTRITRHPLILPVAPWGFATAFLAGGRSPDFVLFLGLAIYAVAGCYCQDLRIIRKEGSVGTVLQPSSDEVTEKLESFYATTSFVPFAAVLDGRQTIGTILKEFPLLPFILGLPVGMLLEQTLLSLLY